MKTLLTVVRHLERFCAGLRKSKPVGTALYSAPEQRAGLECSEKGDIYSLGIILLEMLSPNFRGKGDRNTVLGLRSRCWWLTIELHVLSQRMPAKAS